MRLYTKTFTSRTTFKQMKNSREVHISKKNNRPICFSISKLDQCASFLWKKSDSWFMQLVYMYFVQLKSCPVCQYWIGTKSWFTKINLVSDANSAQSTFRRNKIWKNILKMFIDTIFNLSARFAKTGFDLKWVSTITSWWTTIIVVCHKSKMSS